MDSKYIFTTVISLTNTLSEVVVVDGKVTELIFNSADFKTKWELQIFYEMYLIYLILSYILEIKML